MATGSSDCIEPSMQNFIIAICGVILIFISGMAVGAAIIMTVWIKEKLLNILYSPIPIIKRNNLDAKIIRCISHKIIDYDTLMSLGVELDINPDYIYAIQSDSSKIWEVSFKLLYEWSQRQEDGLRPNSQGLARLKAALNSIHRGAWVQDIQRLERLHHRNR